MQYSSGWAVVMDHSASVLVILAVVACLVGVESFQRFSNNPANNKVFPGTKWCGNGNKSTTYDDLGVFENTDRCCRDHDHCSVFIPTNSAGYGLSNNSTIKPVLHCDCDEEFRHCLQKVNSYLSNLIGTIYFKIMDECIKEEYPIIDCKDYVFQDLSFRCDEYLLDETKPKVYQFFDNLVYKSKK